MPCNMDVAFYLCGLQILMLLKLHIYKQLPDYMACARHISDSENDEHFLNICSPQLLYRLVRLYFL
jgi:hypothetical protein